jgi:cytochrome b561/polyisoprenoid-binding protein YceI
MTDVAKDPQAAGSGRYSTVAILLHWLIAAAIVLQIILSGRMDGPPTPESFAVTQLHKSIGITILLLSLVRLGWRLANPPPPMPQTLPRWEEILAKVVHVGFYVVMIGMPLTGWIMVSASRLHFPTMLYGVVPWPDVPGLVDMAPAAKKGWHTFGETGHGLLAKAIYVLLALHVAGALKHQLLSRDEPVLSRMAPGAVAGRWLEPRILVIALAALGVVGFGEFYQPPHPKTALPPAAVTPQGPAQEPVEAQGPGEPATDDSGASAGLTAGGSAPPPAVAPAAAPPKDTAPVRWKVAAGSTLGFATSWGGDAVQGRFDRWTADILFSPEALDRSKVSVSIDMGSAKTGDEQRDASLPAGDWFDSANHPKATFTATRFEKKGPDRFIAHGTLDLRGVKKPVDLPFTLKISGKSAKVSGTAALDRTEFGVGQGEFKATDQIPAKVTVSVNLQATRD